MKIGKSFGAKLMNELEMNYFMKKWGFDKNSSLLCEVEKLQKRVARLEKLVSSMDIDKTKSYDVKLYQEVKRYYGAE